VQHGFMNSHADTGLDTVAKKGQVTVKMALGCFSILMPAVKNGINHVREFAGRHRAGYPPAEFFKQKAGIQAAKQADPIA